MNSKVKGKRGELEAAHALEEALGVKVRRTAQVDGKLAADLLIEGHPGLHLEVKRHKRIASMEFMRQAVAEAEAGAIPVVLSREDRSGWMVTVRIEDLLGLYRWLGRGPSA